MSAPSKCATCGHDRWGPMHAHSVACLTNLSRSCSCGATPDHAFVPAAPEKCAKCDGPRSATYHEENHANDACPRSACHPFRAATGPTDGVTPVEAPAGVGGGEKAVAPAVTPCERDQQTVLGLLAEIERLNKVINGTISTAGAEIAAQRAEIAALRKCIEEACLCWKSKVPG